MNWMKLVVAALGMALMGPVGCTTLVKQGRSDWRIVIATNAAPAERYAAEELQRYLERISGARLAIGTEAVPAAAHEIVIGKSSRLDGIKPAVDCSKLGSDGFILRSGTGGMVIAGGQVKGAADPDVGRFPPGAGDALLRVIAEAGGAFLPSGGVELRLEPVVTGFLFGVAPRERFLL